MRRGLPWRGRIRAVVRDQGSVKLSLRFAANSRFLTGQERRLGMTEIFLCRCNVNKFHFKLNRAFTWAVVVTVCGVNSSVGAGAAGAMADMGRAIPRVTMRGFSKVSTEA